jgi:hypothetical protein
MGNEFLDLSREITQFVLGFVQNVDQFSFLVFEGGADFPDYFNGPLR